MKVDAGQHTREGAGLSCPSQKEQIINWTKDGWPDFVSSGRGSGQEDPKGCGGGGVRTIGKGGWRSPGSNKGGGKLGETVPIRHRLQDTVLLSDSPVTWEGRLMESPAANRLLLNRAAQDWVVLVCLAAVACNLLLAASFPNLLQSIPSPPALLSLDTSQSLLVHCMCLTHFLKVESGVMM